MTLDAECRLSIQPTVLSVIMLSVIMLSVILLSVMAPILEN
jgi:hypothetical protein